MFHPRQAWPSGSEVNLGRITIPQMKETFASLGSSPYWCWGYEEGINEYGVAIGNEAIRTKLLSEEIVSYKAGNGPKLGPTGMDLLRLGLERGKTARESLQVIGGLVERYGQFGSGAAHGSGCQGRMPIRTLSPTPRKPGSWRRRALIGSRRESRRMDFHFQ